MPVGKRKKCSICKTSKEIDGFSIGKSGKSSSRCKKCLSNYMTERYRTNSIHRKKVSDRLKTLYSRNKSFIDSIKSAVGCIYCSERDCVALDFHHLKDKLFTIGRVSGSASLDRIKNEIVKCEVVCANCHRKLHYGRDLFPEREDFSIIYSSE